MKTLTGAIVLATALVVPAFAVVASAGPTEVIVGGRHIGQDPDPNIRLQLRRDAGSENY